jgi:SAM-dependent methyltransferase
MSFLPFTGGSFDAVVCIRTVNHQVMDGVKRTFTDVRRVLGTGGHFLFTAMKYPPPPDWKQGRFREIENRTFEPLEGHEKGVPHHCFDERELEELMEGFDILDITDQSPEWNSYVVLGRMNRE